MAILTSTSVVAPIQHQLSSSCNVYISSFIFLSYDLLPSSSSCLCLVATRSLFVCVILDDVFSTLPSLGLWLLDSLRVLYLLISRLEAVQVWECWHRFIFLCHPNTQQMHSPLASFIFLP